MRLKKRITGIGIALIFPLSCIHAQLCQGSLGDPIINITFGSGPNPGRQLNAATTSYFYVPNDCPEDGFYTVRSNTTDCFFSTWHNMTSDHTGDPNGYFMLVNASFEPSAFYLDSIKGLCGSTTYEFAAWIVNVLQPFACNGAGIEPNLTFSIENKDGSILQSYNTGDIAALSMPVWKQYGFFFTTPPGVSDIVLRIFNNSKGGCGNDIGLDDITFRPCGPKIIASIDGVASDSVTYCEGPARSFNFTGFVSAGFTNPALQWQSRVDGAPWTDIPGATTTTYSTSFPSSSLPGSYQFRLNASEAGNQSSVQCRVSSTPLTIYIAPIPVTTASSNSPVCAEGTVSFSATGNDHYDWTGVNNYTATGQTVTIPNSTTAQSGEYYVQVTSAAGCLYNDSVAVLILPKPVASAGISNATICEDERIQLSVSGGISYRWEPSTGLSATTISNPMATPSDTTVYSGIVYNELGCTDTAMVTVNVIEKPRANAGPDRTIITGNSTGLSGAVSGQAISFIWSPSTYMNDPLTLRPEVTPPSDINYILTVESELGCGEATDTVHVFVYHDIYVPTAFTPNGDGLNDTWYIPPLNAFSHFQVSVYNRYGELVFQTVDVNTPWDGKFRGVKQSSAVYVYMIRLTDEGRILKGTVTLIR